MTEGITIIQGSLYFCIYLPTCVILSDPLPVYDDLTVGTDSVNLEVIGLLEEADSTIQTHIMHVYIVGVQ